MIKTLIICLTVIFCVVWITLWIKHMVTRNLPMFTYGECVWKDEKASDEPTSVDHPIGFQPEDNSIEAKAKTAKEQKEAYLSDPIALTATLLRGEVDIDDIINRS